jgi:putative oxidoreductase
LVNVNSFALPCLCFSFVIKFFVHQIKKIKMKKTIEWFSNPPTNGQSTILILRLMAGGVFFWEGILKFVYTNQGVGRFTKLGFPMPELTANFVATTEIIGGLFLLFGLFTRFTAFWFIIEMIVAILSTKISLYLGTSPLPIPPAPPKVGIWAVFHEIRSDYAQLLICIFLLIEGAGKKSLDAMLKKEKDPIYETENISRKDAKAQRRKESITNF